MEQQLKMCWCGGATVLVDESLPSQQLTNQIRKCLESDFHVWDSTGVPATVRRLYVAGPMTGYPECNYPEFHRIAAELRAVGFEVVNPAESGADEGSYAALLKKDLIAMLACDAVATHGQWRGSFGASNEVRVAESVKMPVRHWEDWIL